MKGVHVTRAQPPKKPGPWIFRPCKRWSRGWRPPLPPWRRPPIAAPAGRSSCNACAITPLAYWVWCAWRSDELIRLQVEHSEVTVEDGAPVLHLFLPVTKGDRDAQGHTWRLPALPPHCPVAALQDWLAAAQLTEGPVFAGVNRWGQVADDPLHADSVIALLRRALVRVGFAADEAKRYSSHSFRRGFANWVVDNEASVRDLLDWVGWKNLNTAIDYLAQQQALPAKLVQRLRNDEVE